MRAEGEEIYLEIYHSRFLINYCYNTRTDTNANRNLGASLSEVGYCEFVRAPFLVLPLAVHVTKAKAMQSVSDHHDEVTPEA